MEHTKDFKFTIKDPNGKVLVETIATFGSESRPFPKDWKDNAMFQMAIQDFKIDMLQKYFKVEVSEDLEFTLKENL